MVSVLAVRRGASIGGAPMNGLQKRAILGVSLAILVAGCTDQRDPVGIAPPLASSVAASPQLVRELRDALAAQGFTGRIASTLEARLGRPVDHKLADLGRMLWFDIIGGLNDDNTCG